MYIRNDYSDILKYIVLKFLLLDFISEKIRL